MAKEEDNQTVEIDDEGSVTIELNDDELAAAPEGEKKGEEIEAQPEPKKPIVRKRLQEPVEPAPEPKAAEPDETTRALQESLRRAEDARRQADAAAAAERQRARDAVEQAERFRLEAEEARENAENNQLAGLTASIEGTERELTSYKADMVRAQEAGDFAQIADIQVKIAQASARHDRLTSQKETLINAPKRPKPEGRVEPQPSAPAIPTMDQYLSQFAPEAQNWLRAHPECLPSQVGGDASANAKMMAGHYAALAQRITPNTPEYFRVLDEHIKPPVAAEPTPPPAPAPKRQAQPSAPVSREAPSPTSGIPRNTRQVVLSKEQRDMAKLSFPNVPEQQAYALYARNLVELQAEGKIGRTTH